MRSWGTAAGASARARPPPCASPLLRRPRLLERGLPAICAGAQGRGWRGPQGPGPCAAARARRRRASKGRGAGRGSKQWKKRRRLSRRAAGRAAPTGGAGRCGAAVRGPAERGGPAGPVHAQPRGRDLCFLARARRGGARGRGSARRALPVHELIGSGSIHSPDQSRLPGGGEPSP